MLLPALNVHCSGNIVKKVACLSLEICCACAVACALHEQYSNHNQTEERTNNQFAYGH
jgi:hypothetical protein